MAVEDNWSIDDGIWDTWDTHWTPIDETWTTALDLVTTPIAQINWRYSVASTVIGPLLLPNAAQINLRWRVEPLPVEGIVTVPAIMNLRFIINPTALDPITTLPAKINWRYILNPAPVGGMIANWVQINLRWRVEPAPLSGMSTLLTDPGYWTFNGVYIDAPWVDNGPYITESAYIQWGLFGPTDSIRQIRIPAEDRIINVKYEDRTIRVLAEDRIIKIG